MEIKHVISVNVAVLGSVTENHVGISKWNGSNYFDFYSEKVTEVKRLLSFGSVGRKVMTEDLAKRLNVRYDLAMTIVKEIESAL